MGEILNWNLLIPSLILRGFQVGPMGRPQYNIMSPITGFLTYKAVEPILKQMLAQGAAGTAGAAMGMNPLLMLLPLLFGR